MTDNPRQDLEREAREAIDRWELADTWDGSFMRRAEDGGYVMYVDHLAAATAREKELAELSIRNKDLAAAIGAWQSAHESDQQEITSLRAKLFPLPEGEGGQLQTTCGLQPSSLSLLVWQFA